MDSVLGGVFGEFRFGGLCCGLVCGVFVARFGVGCFGIVVFVFLGCCGWCLGVCFVKGVFVGVCVVGVVVVFGSGLSSQSVSGVVLVFRGCWSLERVGFRACWSLEPCLSTGLLVSGTGLLSWSLELCLRLELVGLWAGVRMRRPTHQPLSGESARRSDSSALVWRSPSPLQFISPFRVKLLPI